MEKRILFVGEREPVWVPCHARNAEELAVIRDSMISAIRRIDQLMDEIRRSLLQP